MCLECQGWTNEEVLDLYRQKINQHGWALVSIQARGREAGFTYTIGLTRFHGHPELLVAGMPPQPAAELLNGLAAEVRSGQRLVAGDLLAPGGEHRWQLVRVSDPSRLVNAQAIYAGPAGLVPALQVIWSDHDGRWPWQPGRPGRPARRNDQPLFGRPLHL